MLFTDLAKGLADVPPDRLAGVIMLTDGNVHDVPQNAAALGFDAPVHALITGKPGEFDRRLECCGRRASALSAACSRSSSKSPRARRATPGP